MLIAAAQGVAGRRRGAILTLERHQMPSRMRIMKISHMIVRTSAPSPNAGPRRLDRQHIEQNRQLELIVVGVAHLGDAAASWAPAMRHLAH